jgi:hypothetical protein
MFLMICWEKIHPCFSILWYMGVSTNGDTMGYPKWMVYKGKTIYKWMRTVGSSILGNPCKPPCSVELIWIINTTLWCI